MKEELKTKEDKLGYWMWGADEPATHICEHGHKECAVESAGVCMDWLQLEIDREWPNKEKTLPVSWEDIFNEGKENQW